MELQSPLLPPVYTIPKKTMHRITLATVLSTAFVISIAIWHLTIRPAPSQGLEPNLKSGRAFMDDGSAPILMVMTVLGVSAALILSIVSVMMLIRIKWP